MTNWRERSQFAARIDPELHQWFAEYTKRVAPVPKKDQHKLVEAMILAWRDLPADEQRRYIGQVFEKYFGEHLDEALGNGAAKGKKKR